MFRKAERSKSKLRMAIVGPSGSGKTYTALRIASHLGGNVALLDTERGSAEKYAQKGLDGFAFDVANLDSDFTPDRYISVIHEAEKTKYDVLIIDSLSHAWTGQGGALEMVNNVTAKQKTGNKWAAWREVTPRHNALVDAILQSPCHIICTMRTRTEWVTDERGKPQKIGLAPIQRDGIDYEFDIVCDMDAQHNLIIEKTRCKALDGKVFYLPGADIAETIKDWLDIGDRVEPVVFEAIAPPVIPEASDAIDETQNTKLTEHFNNASLELQVLINVVIDWWKSLNPTLSNTDMNIIWEMCCENFGISSLEELPDSEIPTLKTFLRTSALDFMHSSGMLPEKQR